MTGLLDDALFTDFPDTVNPALENRTIREFRKVVTRIAELVEICDTLLRQLTTSSSYDGENLRAEPSFQKEILGLVVGKANDRAEDCRRKELCFRALLRGSFICQMVAGLMKNKEMKTSLLGVAETMRIEIRN